jgi:hypothetical protein
MPGKLDQISVAVGALSEGIKNINARMDENRDLQSQRHRENSAAMATLTRKVDDQGRKLDEHAAAVASMRPTVAALEVSRSKLAAWASIGFAIVVLAGWIVEAAVKWTIGAVLSHFQ